MHTPVSIKTMYGSAALKAAEEYGIAFHDLKTQAEHSYDCLKTEIEESGDSHLKAMLQALVTLAKVSVGGDGEVFTLALTAHYGDELMTRNEIEFDDRSAT